MTSRNGDYQNWAYRLGQISKSISTGAQYVTPDSKIYCEKVKMCRFSSGYRFFFTKYVKKSESAASAQEIGFSSPNSCSLPWLVQGETQLCTLQNRV
jgi:hypothetical protein